MGLIRVANPRRGDEDRLAVLLGHATRLLRTLVGAMRTGALEKEVAEMKGLRTLVGAMRTSTACWTCRTRCHVANPRRGDEDSCAR